MSEKTHKTALVLIPPDEICSSIQSIRKKYDKQYRRWMPHITLLYPFKPKIRLDEICATMPKIAQTLQPFPIHLSDFRYFRHRSNRFTIWLHPDPSEKIIELQSHLLNHFPNCNEVNQHPHGFTPHLTVGQASSQSLLEELLDTLNQSWEPQQFQINRLFIICRNDPPDDIFKVECEIPFGNQTI